MAEQGFAELLRGGVGQAETEQPDGTVVAVLLGHQAFEVHGIKRADELLVRNGVLEPDLRRNAA